MGVRVVSQPLPRKLAYSTTDSESERSSFEAWQRAQGCKIREARWQCGERICMLLPLSISSEAYVQMISLTSERPPSLVITQPWCMAEAAASNRRDTESSSNHGATQAYNERCTTFPCSVASL